MALVRLPCAVLKSRGIFPSAEQSPIGSSLGLESELTRELVTVAKRATQSYISVLEKDRDADTSPLGSSTDDAQGDTLGTALSHIIRTYVHTCDKACQQTVQSESDRRRLSESKGSVDRQGEDGTYFLFTPANSFAMQQLQGVIQLQPNDDPATADFAELDAQEQRATSRAGANSNASDALFTTALARAERELEDAAAVYLPSILVADDRYPSIEALQPDTPSTPSSRETATPRAAIDFQFTAEGQPLMANAEPERIGILSIKGVLAASLYVAGLTTGAGDGESGSISARHSKPSVSAASNAQPIPLMVVHWVDPAWAKEGPLALRALSRQCIEHAVATFAFPSWKPVLISTLTFACHSFSVFPLLPLTLTEFISRRPSRADDASEAEWRDDTDEQCALLGFFDPSSLLNLNSFGASSPYSSVASPSSPGSQRRLRRENTRVFIDQICLPSGVTAPFRPYEGLDGGAYLFLSADISAEDARVLFEGLRRNRPESSRLTAEATSYQRMATTGPLSSPPSGSAIPASPVTRGGMIAAYPWPAKHLKLLTLLDAVLGSAEGEGAVADMVANRTLPQLMHSQGLRIRFLGELLAELVEIQSASAVGKPTPKFNFIPQMQRMILSEIVLRSMKRLNRSMTLLSRQSSTTFDGKQIPSAALDNCQIEVIALFFGNYLCTLLLHQPDELMELLTPVIEVLFPETPLAHFFTAAPSALASPAPANKGRRGSLLGAPQSPAVASPSASNKSFLHVLPAGSLIHALQAVQGFSFKPRHWAYTPFSSDISTVFSFGANTFKATSPTNLGAGAPPMAMTDPTEEQLHTHNALEGRSSGFRDLFTARSTCCPWLTPSTLQLMRMWSPGKVPAIFEREKKSFLGLSTIAIDAFLGVMERGWSNQQDLGATQPLSEGLRPQSDNPRALQHSLEASFMESLPKVGTTPLLVLQILYELCQHMNDVTKDAGRIFLKFLGQQPRLGPGNSVDQLGGLSLSFASITGPASPMIRDDGSFASQADSRQDIASPWSAVMTPECSPRLASGVLVLGELLCSRPKEQDSVPQGSTNAPNQSGGTAPSSVLPQLVKLVRWVLQPEAKGIQDREVANSVVFPKVAAFANANEKPWILFQLLRLEPLGLFKYQHRRGSGDKGVSWDRRSSSESDHDVSLVARRRSTQRHSLSQTPPSSYLSHQSPTILNNVPESKSSAASRRLSSAHLSSPKDSELLPLGDEAVPFSIDWVVSAFNDLFSGTRSPIQRQPQLCLQYLEAIGKRALQAHSDTDPALEKGLEVCYAQVRVGPTAMTMLSSRILLHKASLAHKKEQLFTLPAAAQPNFKAQESVKWKPFSDESPAATPDASVEYTQSVLEPPAGRSPPELLQTHSGSTPAASPSSALQLQTAAFLSLLPLAAHLNRDLVPIASIIATTNLYTGRSIEGHTFTEADAALLPEVVALRRRLKNKDVARILQSRMLLVPILSFLSRLLLDFRRFTDAFQIISEAWQLASVLYRPNHPQRIEAEALREQVAAQHLRYCAKCIQRCFRVHLKYLSQVATRHQGERSRLETEAIRNMTKFGEASLSQNTAMLYTYLDEDTVVHFLWRVNTDFAVIRWELQEAFARLQLLSQEEQHAHYTHGQVRLMQSTRESVQMKQLELDFLMKEEQAGRLELTIEQFHDLGMMFKTSNFTLMFQRYSKSFVDFAYRFSIRQVEGAAEWLLAGTRIIIGDLIATSRLVGAEIAARERIVAEEKVDFLFSFVKLRCLLVAEETGREEVAESEAKTFYNLARAVRSALSMHSFQEAVEVIESEDLELRMEVNKADFTFWELMKGQRRLLILEERARSKVGTEGLVSTIAFAYVPEVNEQEKLRRSFLVAGEMEARFPLSEVLEEPFQRMEALKVENLTFYLHMRMCCEEREMIDRLQIAEKDEPLVRQRVTIEVSESVQRDALIRLWSHGAFRIHLDAIGADLALQSYSDQERTTRFIISRGADLLLRAIYNQWEISRSEYYPGLRAIRRQYNQGKKIAELLTVHRRQRQGKFIAAEALQFEEMTVRHQFTVDSANTFPQQILYPWAFGGRFLTLECSLIRSAYLAFHQVHREILKFFAKSTIHFQSLRLLAEAESEKEGQLELSHVELAESRERLLVDIEWQSRIRVFIELTRDSKSTSPQATEQRALIASQYMARYLTLDLYQVHHEELLLRNEVVLQEDALFHSIVLRDADGLKRLRFRDAPRDTSIEWLYATILINDFVNRCTDVDGSKSTTLQQKREMDTNQQQYQFLCLQPSFPIPLRTLKAGPNAKVQIRMEKVTTLSQVVQLVLGVNQAAVDPSLALPLKQRLLDLNPTLNPNLPDDAPLRGHQSLLVECCQLRAVALIINQVSLPGELRRLLQDAVFSGDPARLYNFVDITSEAGRRVRVQRSEETLRKHLVEVFTVERAEFRNRRLLELRYLATGLTVFHKHLNAWRETMTDEARERLAVAVLMEEDIPRLGIVSAERRESFSLKKMETLNRPPKDASALYLLLRPGSKASRVNGRGSIINARSSISQPPAVLSPLFTPLQPSPMLAAPASTQGTRSPLNNSLRSPEGTALNSSGVAASTAVAMAASRRQQRIQSALNPLDGFDNAPALELLVDLLKHDATAFRSGLYLNTIDATYFFDGALILSEHVLDTKGPLMWMMLKLYTLHLKDWKEQLEYGKTIVQAHLSTLREHRAAVQRLYADSYWALKRLKLERQETNARAVVEGSQSPVFEKMVKNFLDDAVIIQMLSDIRSISGVPARGVSQLKRSRTKLKENNSDSTTETMLEPGETAQTDPASRDVASGAGQRARMRSPNQTLQQRCLLVIEEPKPIEPLYVGTTFAESFHQHQGEQSVVRTECELRSHSLQQSWRVEKGSAVNPTIKEMKDAFVQYTVDRYSAIYQAPLVRGGVFVPLIPSLNTKPIQVAKERAVPSQALNRPLSPLHRNWLPSESAVRNLTSPPPTGSKITSMTAASRAQSASGKPKGATKRR